MIDDYFKLILKIVPVYLVRERDVTYPCTFFVVDWHPNNLTRISWCMVTCELVTLYKFMWVCLQVLRLVRNIKPVDPECWEVHALTSGLYFEYCILYWMTNKSTLETSGIVTCSYNINYISSSFQFFNTLWVSGWNKVCLILMYFSSVASDR